MYDARRLTILECKNEDAEDAVPALGRLSCLRALGLTLASAREHPVHLPSMAQLASCLTALKLAGAVK